MWLLEAYNISLSIDKVVSNLNDVGITFVYAPLVNPVFKKISHIRKDLGFRSCFNILGPFLNPLPINTILLGVYSKDILDETILILKSLDYSRAMVVNCYGLDKISTIGNIDYRELNNGKIISEQLNPLDYGFKLGQLEDFTGGNPTENKQLIDNI